MKSLTEEMNAFNASIQEKFGAEIDSIELKEIEEDQQRTEQWHKDRRGMFTGSGGKMLMACKMRASAKNPKDWGQKKWLCSLGDSALNYIVERAIERVTGVNIEKYLSWHAKWGLNHEDEGKAYVSEVDDISIREKGFVKFLKNAGASPDGIIQNILLKNDELIVTNGVDQAFEIKCPATVLSHMDLMNSPVCEGHTYFWQIQFEIMALNTKGALFYTYDKRFPEYAKLGRQGVELSPIHAFAVEFRLIVAEKLVSRILEKKFKLSTADLYAELADICEDIPEDLDELQNWFSDERAAITI